MGFNQFCVCRHTLTFSSDLDGGVFLCVNAGTKHSAISSQPSACCLRIQELKAES
jgi:hypothetical protein